MDAQLTPQQVAEMVERLEGEAWEDWWGNVPPTAAEPLGISVKRIGSAVGTFLAALPAPDVNRVMSLGIGVTATEQQVDEWVSAYRSLRLPFMVHVSPAAMPTQLADWLQARSLSRRDNWVKMYRSTDDPPEWHTNLRIAEAGNADVDDYARIVSVAFGMPSSIDASIAAVFNRPDWRRYIAFEDETPIGAGALFIRGEVGWLGHGATLPEYRNRGAQGALMARRIKDAGALGCRWVVTETDEETPTHPNPSYRNMVRTGFKLAYARANYVSDVGESAQ